MQADEVSSDMRARLLTNRDGRLTTSQWKELVTEPLIKLMLLMVPGIILLGPRLYGLFFGGAWMLGIGALVLLAGMLFVRAGRYARAPLHYQILNVREEIPRLWVFGRRHLLYNEDGEAIKFNRQFAPSMRLKSGQRYLVYYLQDVQTNILLSMAPADHPDAGSWEPTQMFHNRKARRGSR
jgi:hypothetical protein